MTPLIKINLLVNIYPLFLIYKGILSIALAINYGIKNER